MAGYSRWIVNRPKEEGLGDRVHKQLYGSADNTVLQPRPPDQKQGPKESPSQNVSQLSEIQGVCVGCGWGWGGRDSASLHCLDHGLQENS